MLKCERERLNFWFMGAEVGERPYQGGLFIFDFINSDISRLDIDYILKYLILDISDIPHKVEIHGSTVSMAFTSKPTSEHTSEDSYPQFVFAVLYMSVFRDILIWISTFLVVL